MNLEKANLNNISINPSKDTTFGRQECKIIEDNLMMFYILIISGLFYENYFFKNYPDILKYAINSGFAKPNTTVSPDDTKGTKIIMNDNIFNVDKLNDLRVYLNGDGKDLLIKDKQKHLENILNILNEASPGLIEGIDKIKEINSNKI